MIIFYSYSNASKYKGFLNSGVSILTLVLGSYGFFWFVWGFFCMMLKELDIKENFYNESNKIMFCIELNYTHTKKD